MSDLFGHDAPGAAQALSVQLPGGGNLYLQTSEEVQMWEATEKRYREDYGLVAQNDLILLGAILSQQLAMFRAQGAMNGMEAETDAAGIPTGRYKKKEVKASDLSTATAMVTKCASEIRELEKALGVDKKTRDSGGQQTVQGYVSALKAAGRMYGLHVTKRMKAYEKVAMEARWKLRVLRNGDAEDRAYHNLTPDSVLAWLEEELQSLEQIDQEFAKEIGKAYAGVVR